MRRWVPVRVRDLAGLVLGLVALLSLLRGVFWLAFRRMEVPLESGRVVDAFALGLRFDLRLALLLCLPFALLTLVPRLDPHRSRPARRFWTLHLTTVSTLALLVHVADFGHYDYLRTRVDASALRFLEDGTTSLLMVLETYPVWPFLLGIGAVVVLTYHSHARWLGRAAQPCTAGAVPRWGIGAVTTALVLAGLHGKVSRYPLRWSDAFAATDRFAAHLALNPALYFADTLATHEAAGCDRAELEAYYPAIADYLGVDRPDLGTLSLARRVRPTPLLDREPNVVVILMESFAAHLTGTFGNPLDPTPCFDRVAAGGILWRNFYTPRVGTARGVFALVTGLPDLTTVRTASRNPRLVEQHTIAAELDGYEKHYFLGGSANWANIRGLLAHNIPGLVIHEEGSYPDAPRADVWGISDLHLFDEVNRALREVDAPFLAFVHLSGNHPPYTIPRDSRGFERRSATPEALRSAGFGSQAELDSLRFMDHALGVFFAAAEQEAYFEDTLFFLLSDNGAPNLADHQPEQDRRFWLQGFHSPLVLYGAGLTDGGQVRDEPATQMDVMPTVAGAIGRPVPNRSLGRNLLDPRFERYAFVQSQRGATPTLGLLGAGFYACVDRDGGHPTLSPFGAGPTCSDDLRERTTDLALGLYHAARWQLHGGAAR